MVQRTSDSSDAAVLGWFPGNAVMMPVLDGFGLLQALRSNPKTSALPLILLSARAGEEARVEGGKRLRD